MMTEFDQKFLQSMGVTDGDSAVESGVTTERYADELRLQLEDAHVTLLHRNVDLAAAFAERDRLRVKVKRLYLAIAGCSFVIAALIIRGWRA